MTMSDFEKLAPVGSVSQIKMRKVDRREKDGREGNRDWQDELEQQMQKGHEEEPQGQEKEEQKSEEKNDKKVAPPPSKPIVIHNHLDVKA